MGGRNKLYCVNKPSVKKLPVGGGGGGEMLSVKKNSHVKNMYGRGKETYVVYISSSVKKQ